MKKIGKIFLVGIITGFLSLGLQAQQGPPPPPEDPSLGGEAIFVGGDAPVGSGVAILLTLGATYAGVALYRRRKEQE